MNQEIVREFNFNPTYFSKLLAEKGVTIDMLRTLWADPITGKKKSLAAVYSRRSGTKPLPIDEAFALAELMGIDVNIIFAPTQEELMGVLCNDKQN